MCPYFAFSANIGLAMRKSFAGQGKEVVLPMQTGSHLLFTYWFFSLGFGKQISVPTLKNPWLNPRDKR